MEQVSFFAKIETINNTSYETNTVRVLVEDKTGQTLRINEEEAVVLNGIYYFGAIVDINNIVSVQKNAWTSFSTSSQYSFLKNNSPSFYPK